MTATSRPGSSSPRYARRPWEEAYRRQGRLYGGERVDALTARSLADDSGAAHMRWLDAGCGDGKGLIPLQARVQTAPVGADRSVWALRRARERAAAGGAPAPFLVRADARAWPWRDESFDRVRAVHVFGHLWEGDQARGWAEAARVLRAGGLLVLAEFGRGDFRYGQGERVADHAFRRHTGIVTHYYASDDLRALAAGAGLEVDRLDAERFTVSYEGRELPRERWLLVARRPAP